jgi:type II secretory pathway component PulF
MSTTFAYRGIDEIGKPVHGEITADDLKSATAVLKGRAIYPMTVTPTKTQAETTSAKRGLFPSFMRRDMAADVAIFTRQLANLVAGGVPMMTSFSALSSHTENLRLQFILETMQNEVRGGKPLWEALTPHPEAFPPMYINMVRAGEASGQLSSVLNWLADYQEKEQTRRMQIRGALAYPLLLLVAGSLAIVMLIVLVVPKFAGMFADFGQKLPLPTLMLLSTASFCGHWGWAVVLGIVALVCAFRYYARTPRGRFRVDGLRLRIPMLGKLAVKSAMSRFAHTTATLMLGGVPLLEALGVVRDVMGNEVLAQATDHAREGMREGERFAERLRATGVFPPFLTHMIGIGEETGDLRNMLNTVAGTYDIEVDTTLKALVSVLEPIIIITIGGIIGFVIMSMLLPIFQLDVMGG